jgi:hypothetical protein
MYLRLRASENQVERFGGLVSDNDPFLEQAPSCLLDVRDACPLRKP